MHFAFCHLSPQGCFAPLDLVSEYRIQHDTIGPLYNTSRYSTRILYRGVSGFATDWPCGVWCRELTTCLLYVGPLFWNSTFKQQLGIMDCDSSFLSYFDIYNCICLNTSYDFMALSLHLKQCSFVSSTPLLKLSIDIVTVAMESLCHNVVAYRHLLRGAQFSKMGPWWFA